MSPLSPTSVLIRPAAPVLSLGRGVSLNAAGPVPSAGGALGAAIFDAPSTPMGPPSAPAVGPKADGSATLSAPVGRSHSPSGGPGLLGLLLLAAGGLAGVFAVFSTGLLSASRLVAVARVGRGQSRALPVLPPAAPAF